MKITSTRIKLKDVTFVRGGKVRYDLLWCNKLGRARKCKPAKVNGVLVSEVQPYYGQLS